MSSSGCLAALCLRSIDQDNAGNQTAIRELTGTQELPELLGENMAVQGEHAVRCLKCLVHTGVAWEFFLDV